MKFRTLKADEIDVKVGNVTKSGYTLLLYKNARVDMTILDETVGVANWQRDHKEVKGNLYCGIGINFPIALKQPQSDVEVYFGGNSETILQDRWVWKWDCGVESAFGDKEKGEASDSFKRAGFNWGIGRELYTSPSIKIDCETLEEKDKNGKIVYKIPNKEKYRTFRVKEIEYNDKREISKLIIIDNNNVQVFPKNKIENHIENITTAPVEDFDLKMQCFNCGQDISEKVAKYSLAKFGRELCYDCQRQDKLNEVEV